MADNNQTLVAGGVGTAFTVVLFVVFKLVLPFFNAANHHRVRSVCCGRSCVSSLDVEDTTPTPPRIVQVLNTTESGVRRKSGVGDPKTPRPQNDQLHTTQPSADT
jgi:hypothetical protein